MPITDENVRDVAMLAKLCLSEAEIKQYTHQLDLILGYMELLNQLDTSQEEVTAHLLPMPCPLREDLGPDTSDDPAAILDQAPDREQDYFRVPKIID